MALVGRSCRTRDDRETIAFGESLSRTEAIVADGGHRAHVPLLDLARRRAGATWSTGPPTDRPERRAAPAGRGLHARPAGADQGPAGEPPHPPRRVLDGAVAVARRDAAALLARPRAAQRPARPDPRRGRLGGHARLLGRRARDRGRRVDRPPRRGRRSPGAGLRGRAAGARPRRGRGDRLPPAQRGDRRRRRSRPSSPSVATATSPGATPGRARTTTSSRSSRGGRSLRRYGSQGQQRAALLALLFAERDALIADGRPAPLMLLDDVTSELDADHRAPARRAPGRRRRPGADDGHRARPPPGVRRAQRHRDPRRPPARRGRRRPTASGVRRAKPQLDRRTRSARSSATRSPPPCSPRFRRAGATAVGDQIAEQAWPVRERDGDDHRRVPRGDLGAGARSASRRAARAASTTELGEARVERLRMVVGDGRDARHNLVRDLQVFCRRLRGFPAAAAAILM